MSLIKKLKFDFYQIFIASNERRQRIFQAIKSLGHKKFTFKNIT